MTFSKKAILTFVTFAMVISGAVAEGANQGVSDLSRIYNEALNNSPQYKANYYTMRSTQSNQDIALGALLPNLTFSAVAQQTYGQSGNTSGTYRAYSAGAELKQVLFDYNLYQTYQSTKQSSLQAEETYASQKQTFILNVATAYFNVLNAKDQLSFAKANLDAVKSTLEQSEVKAKVGMATQVDVKVAEANYYSALAQLKADENSLQSAYYQLYQYTGVKTEALAALKNGLNFTKPYPDDIDAWVEKGEMNNTSLRAQIYAQAAAQKALSATTGAFLPTVSLDAQYNVNDFKGDSSAMAANAFAGALSTAPGNVKTGYIGLTFTWNILNGGADYATRKQAAFSYQAAEFSTLDQQRTIKQSIQADFYNVVSAVKQIQALRQSVIAAESSYEQYQARYKVGTATVNDVLTQLQTLYQNKSLLATATYSYITSVLQLKLDAGTLSEKDINAFNSWLEI